MLRYATTRLRGRALRWHAKLDPSAQENWYQFVQALFEEYPLVEEHDGGEIATPGCPTPFAAALPGSNRPPATASIPQSAVDVNQVVPPTIMKPPNTLPPGSELVPPPRVYDSPLPGYYMGRLRVVSEDSRTGPLWIRANLASIHITSNIYEALIVTFISSPKCHHIGCLKNDNPKLGVRIHKYYDSCSEFHPLKTASGPDVHFSIDGSGYQVVSVIWIISADGTLNATLPNLVQDPKNANRMIHSGNYSTTSAYVDISGVTVSFVNDYSTPRATHPSSGLPLLRARIVFEPL